MRSYTLIVYHFLQKELRCPLYFSFPKRFDTVEVLQHHQVNCRDFLAKQSKDARQRLDEKRKEQAKAGGEQ